MQTRSASKHAAPTRRRRRRVVDSAVALVSLMLVCAPIIPIVHAAAPLVQSQITVDERVRPAALISQPQDAQFDVAREGKSTGAVGWDIWTSSPNGYKLVVTSDRSPAMQDARSGVSIGDMSGTPEAWNVGAGDRKFGISARGDQALNRYDNGASWRGLNGRRGVEIARHTGGSVALTRTWLRLASEFASPVSNNSRPTAHVTATVVPNL